MWPPPIPQCPDIFPRRSFENAQVGRLEKTGHTKKQRFALVGSVAEQIQRQALRDQRKRQFVFLITERRSQFLKERLVTPMVVYLIANPSAFLLQPKLRCGIKHTADTLFGQIFERRLTTTRSRQRDIFAECIR